MGRLLELRCPAAECGGETLSFLSVTTESGAEIASHLTGAGEGVRFSESGRLGLGCVTPGVLRGLLLGRGSPVGCGGQCR